jgi:hypothetical protein
VDRRTGEQAVIKGTSVSCITTFLSSHVANKIENKRQEFIGINTLCFVLCFFARREEHRLRVFGNRELRRIFGRIV